MIVRKAKNGLTEKNYFYNMQTLLAIDLGVKTGYACYRDDGMLVWAQSHNYGNARRLKNGVYGIFQQCENLTQIVIEGGGHLEKHWIKLADKKHISVRRIHAHEWREPLFPGYRKRSSKQWKSDAIKTARAVLELAAISAPKTMMHDQAEAILIGLWACKQTGWIDTLPK
jgi:hypothetical protein